MTAEDSTPGLGSPHLEFVEVTKRFSQLTVVDRVSFSVQPGQFCVLLGPSGAGKSTLLRMVNGLEIPDGGRVVFGEHEVNATTLPKLRQRMAMVHQQFHLVPRLNVLQNVLAGCLSQVSTARSLLGLFPASLKHRACELLRAVGLEPSQLYRPAAQLSGGEQQRVAIARAFISAPELVLADEPVASLDPETSRSIMKLLRDAAREQHATVVCSLHQVDLARTFADRIIGLRGGKRVFDASAIELTSEAGEMIYRGERNA